MDFLPTKGIEYLLAIGYLLLSVPFWFFVMRQRKQPAMAPALAAQADRGPGWFRVPAGFHFHRGHTWAQPDGSGLLRVGMDDFARLLIGRPQAVTLPGVGDRVTQGETGWIVKVDGRDVALLSPVGGEIAEVNGEALANPAIVQDDPYGHGWLFKVRPSATGGGLKNLLPAPLARTWMAETSNRLSTMMAPDVGMVLQDGGVLVSGMARELAGDEWHKLVADMFLTD